MTKTVRSDKTGLKKAVKAIGRILSILSIVFIVYKIYKLGFDVSSIDNVPAFVGVALLAVALKMLSVVTSSSAWGRWISFFSHSRIRFREIFAIYGKAAIGKYLPGNVMHYVGRNIFAAEYGLSQKKIAFSSIVESGELVVSAFLIAVVLLPASFKEKVAGLVADRKGTVFVVGIVCVIVFVLLVFYVIGRAHV